MNNRQNTREELNDILGDISPYWNMNIYNSEDDNNDNDDEYYDDELDEYDNEYDDYW